MKSRKALKNLFAVFLVLAFLFFLLGVASLVYAHLKDTGILTKLKGFYSSPSAFVTSITSKFPFFSKKTTAIGTINANLVFLSQRSFSIVPNSPCYLSITFSANNPIMLGGSFRQSFEITTGNKEFEFDEFLGNVQIIGNSLSIDGSSKTIKFGKIKMRYQNSRVYIKGNDLKYKKIVFKNADVSGLNLPKVSGTIKMVINGDQVLYKVKDKSINIEEFNGNLEIFENGTIVLLGKAKVKTADMIVPA